jgi:hypothetical protein
MLGAITPDMWLTREGQAQIQAIQQAAKDYAHPWSIEALGDAPRLHEPGDHRPPDADAGDSGAQGERALAAVSMEEVDALRDLYYDNLQRLTGKDLRAMKRYSSDMVALQKAVGPQVGKEMKAAAAGRAHRVLGSPGSWRRKAGRTLPWIGTAVAGGELYKDVFGQRR